MKANISSVIISPSIAYVNSMRLDRGNIFLAFTGLMSIVLIVALAAAVVTGPASPAHGLSSSDNNESSFLATLNGQLAQPTYKMANYPGISRSYACSYMTYRTHLYSQDGSMSFNPGGELTSLGLNDDGTVSVTLKWIEVPYFLTITHYDVTVTGGHWYKIKGKGHSLYLDANFYATLPRDSYYTIEITIPAQVVDLYNLNGHDSGVQEAYGHIYGSFNGSTYNNWDAGYATMGASADSLAPLIDACVPADVARPFIEKGYTGEQALPYIYYNMPQEAADYFKSQGISGELCGPYYAAGISREDIMAYLDSGFTADQIMPFIHAGVPESDILACLDAGYTYDIVSPFINAKVGISDIMTYLSKGYTFDKAGPFINAGVQTSDIMTYLSKGYTFDRAGPFINAGVQTSDIMTYLNAGVTYDKAKPYISANASASIATPYAASSYAPEQCLPYANANITLSKARPFLLLNIPPDQAVIYITNGISATAAKPYVDAGVTADKAVDEIKKGIPPTK